MYTMVLFVNALASSFHVEVLFICYRYNNTPLRIHEDVIVVYPMQDTFCIIKIVYRKQCINLIYKLSRISLNLAHLNFIHPLSTSYMKIGSNKSQVKSRRINCDCSRNENVYPFSCLTSPLSSFGSSHTWQIIEIV